MLKPSPLVALVKDIQQFTSLNKSLIKAFPLQTYISALIFSPIPSITHQIFKDSEPEWLIFKLTVKEEWGSYKQTLEGHSKFATSVAFSHDGQKIVSGFCERTVQVWDAATESLQQTLEDHLDSVTSVTFSRNGQKIVSRSRNITVQVWDATTGLLQQTLKGHLGLVTSVAFSHDSQKIVSGSNDKTVRVWDVATGSLQQTFQGHYSSVISATFSHDSQKVIFRTKHNTIQVWDVATGSRDSQDVATGSQEKRLKGHSGSVTSIAASLYSHPKVILVDGQWVTIHGKKALWLPFNHRGCSDSLNNSLVIGSRSGPVTIMRFDLNKI